MGRRLTEAERTLRTAVAEAKKAAPKRRRGTICYEDGIKFESTKERANYLILKDLLHDNQIRNLQPNQEHPKKVSYTLYAGAFQPIGRYTPDFTFERLTECGDWEFVVQDVKPKDRKTGKFRLTEAYNLRKKVFEACYPWKIEEV